MTKYTFKYYDRGILEDRFRYKVEAWKGTEFINQAGSDESFEEAEKSLISCLQGPKFIKSKTIQI